MAMAFQRVWGVRVLGLRFKFLVEIPKSSRFQGTLKDLGYIYRCGFQAPYCKGYPMTPTQFLEVLRCFWGLEGSIGVRLQCLGQKNGNLSLNGMLTKHKYLVTPNFQGS